jgi:salicylate hydroxylase
MPAKSGRFIIVGGGIGGLAAALAMARTGREVLVLERATEFAEIGAGVQFGPNGFKMLERLGLGSAANDLAVFPSELRMMDSISGEQVTTINVEGPFRAKFGYPYALIHRADLHRVLLDACSAHLGIELRNSQTFVECEETAAGVVARTKEGEVFEGEALIGADGLWSKLRERIVGDGAPRVSGHIAYRAVLPIEAVEEKYRANAMTLWAGPKNHLVHYPLRGGKLFNLVAVFHSDRYVEGWDTRGDPDELRVRFGTCCETVKALLDKVETWRMWVLCDRDPVTNWSKGRMTLLGDAAHPMLQYLAQGACMAIEDAFVLSQAVEAHGNNVAAAFRNYQASRYLRTGKCQLLARYYGDAYHASGVARELRNQMLAGRTNEAALAGMAWLYDGI